MTQRELTLLGAGGRKVISLAKKEGSNGAAIEILYGPDTSDPEGEAGALLEALLELPVETRAAFYRLLTTEHAEGFCGASRPKPKVHKWPPSRRGGG